MNTDSLIHVFLIDIDNVGLLVNYWLITGSPVSDFSKTFKYKFVHLGGDEVNTSKLLYSLPFNSMCIFIGI